MEETKIAVESRFEKETRATIAALRDLTEALLNGPEGLFTKTANAIAPLREEADRLNAEAKTLSEAAEKLRPMAEARQRVISRQTDDLLAAGDEEQAGALRAEGEELGNNLKNTLDRAQSCRTRAMELQRQIQSAGAKIYAETHPEIRLSTVEVCREIVNLFDAVRDGIQRHSFQHSYRLNQQDLAHLTGYEHGPERPISLALMRIFGGR